MPDSDRAGRELAVTARGLTKQFGEGEAAVRALDDADFDVRYGELTLLVGPSGCGKTTMLSVVAGLLPATSGDVTVLGEDLFAMADAARTRFRGANIGFVFQQHNLLPALSARENAAVPLLLGGRPRDEAIAAAAEVLDDIGLGARADAAPETLSGGERQRVALARALVHRPRLLVCDEPTASLDARRGEQVMTTLRDAAVADDRAVVVVTHDQRLFHFGDRIAEMDDGRVTEVTTDVPTEEETQP